MSPVFWLKEIRRIVKYTGFSVGNSSFWHPRNLSGYFEFYVYGGTGIGNSKGSYLPSACAMVSTDFKLGNPFVVSRYIFLSFM
jgi:hypothetical protein